MAEPPAGVDVLDLVSRALRASYESAGALVIPTILLDRDLLEEAGQHQHGAKLADVVAEWFRRHGFYAERSHVGGHGYGEIIKEIRGWYPDDSDTLFSQHEKELDQREDALAKSGCRS